MEVTHREDKVTHAVITAHRAMDVMVSDDATFLHTLTATLYSDQKGAVVREILCNAWDAHKVAGRKHIPVQVTLTHNSMSFKDNGLGIPPGLEMQKIYGTFGGSTKRNDGHQTGGFGLGSKAPWAYSDQFTVISCHKGTKTIYNMSKSSAEVGGKPSIIPITSLPTEEEGVTVTVPIKGVDYHTFTLLIKKFVLYGDMNVVLNKEVLPTIAFNSIREKYVVSTEVNNVSSSYDRILLRYGDVIYPLGSKHEMFVEQYRTAENIVTSLGPNWKLILLADPNTISVTPSRESLSMQTHTATTVKTLLENFIQKTVRSAEAKALSEKILVEGLQKVKQESKIPGLLRMNRVVAGAENIGDVTQALKIIHEPELITKVILKRNYPNHKKFRTLDVETRLNHLIEEGIGNAGLVKTFMDLWEKSKTQLEDGDVLKWLQKRVIGQVRRKINKSETMKESRLFLVGHSYEYLGGINEWRVLDESLTKTTQVTELPLEELVPYLRNIVVLSFTRNDVIKLFLRQKQIMEKYGKHAKFLLYVVPRSAKALAEARKQLSSLNAVFVDLTVGLETVYEKKDPSTAKKAKKASGYPILSEALDPTNNVFNMRNLLLSTATRSEQFEFYLYNVTSNIKESPTWFSSSGWMRSIGTEIVSLFGSKGVLVTTATQAAVLEKRGVVCAEYYVIDKVGREIATNPIYKEFIANDVSLLEESLKENVFTDLCEMLAHKSIREQFNVQVTLTLEQSMYLRIARKLIEYLNETDPKIEPIVKVLNKTEPSKAMKKLVEAVKKSTMLHWVDVSKVASTIAGKDATKSNVAMSLLKYALKS